MGYIYAFIAVIAFYTAIHRFTELQLKQKIFVTLTFMGLVLLFVWFESYNDKERDRINALSFAFEHNRTLVCEESLEINKESFNYSVGGHSFLGKADSAVQGMIIPISTCKIKE